MNEPQTPIQWPQNGKPADDEPTESEERDVSLAQVRLTKPLDLSDEDPGGDPYNSTGTFAKLYR